MAPSERDDGATPAPHTRRPVMIGAFGGATFLGALGTDAFLPAMVALADAFSADIGLVQFGLAAFFFGATIGQALVGPLADRFGRRPVLLAGIALYAVSALMAVWAGNIYVLIALRFVQGASGASGRIVVRAIVRDMYARETGARMLSYVTMVGTTIPIFSPIVSAQLLIHFGWPAVFLFMAAFAAALFALIAVYVEESLGEKDIHAIRPFTMLFNFVDIARNKVFLTYAALAVGPPLGLNAFLTGSAAVLIGTYGLAPDRFSFVFALVMVSNTVCAFVNARLVSRLGFGRTTFMGTVLCAAAGLSLLGLALGGVATVAAIIVPMMAYMAGMAFVTPQAQAGALSPFPQRAGAASSLIGIMQGLLGTASATAVGLMPKETAVPMASITAGAGIAILLIFVFAARRIEARR